ncbi:MAG: AbrB/MazE/SpoVT family DNA-binding domain-containing protein [Bacteroidetes bacterium]|nr:AbrB/MazE/SpoVT family DNA-binding domain-containing protein [Bacteroidota bacterium]MCH8524543.1 AbrB/MazE/SpoVT family DNA-binding domain-containing protein [Balneolales bacterium]
MKTKLIRIGNSKGIRIPKPVLEQLELTDEVELIVGVDEIILRSVSSPREGWDNAFKSMAENRDDTLLDVHSPSLDDHWNEDEWTW